jgi:glycosyltransferase involved in cell wall biosynthesis
VFSIVILARNEERNIVACSEAARRSGDEVLLIDMESTDRTVELARPLVDKVLSHPLVANFDAARNIAIPEARFDWLWFVDADERIPPETHRVVRELVRDSGAEFEALSIPFKSYFCGQWMRYCGWWPGYTMPRVLKRGFFRFSEKLHGGVELTGREARIPPDPKLGIDHYSYESVDHYIEKLNRYTSTEAAELHQQNVQWDWRAAMSHMLHDLWMYYELNPGRLDGERGWILSWLSGQYRFLQHAKLIDHGPPREIENGQPNAPVNLDDMLLFMEEELAALRARRPQVPLAIVWRSPLFDYSGYADEGRAFAKALAHGERALALEEIRWNDKTCALPRRDAVLLRALTGRRRGPFVATITDCIPTLVQPDRSAALNILRTTFEVDRIPADWLPAIERFDEVWVTSHFAAEAFRRSWVAPEKLHVVHPCIDTELFAPDGQQRPRPEKLHGRFLFLSVLEWQLRKGWDVLLRAYVTEFVAGDGTALVMKVSCLHGQSISHVRQQADEVLAQCGTSLAQRSDIVLLPDVLEADQMAALYRSADAFVLPTRGEGWGRPFMEALACGVPVIATAASGQMDFLHGENALLVPATDVPVSDEAVAEIFTYAGARWFEPDQTELQAAMRRMLVEADLRRRLIERGLADVSKNFSLDCGRRSVETALATAEKRYVVPALPAASESQVCVELEGELFAGHSFANINEQIALHLAQDPSIALSICRRQYNPVDDHSAAQAHQLLAHVGRSFGRAADIVIRHSFPPNFEPPASGKWIHIQPWEFGHLPLDWIAPLRDQVDEIWAPSSYVKRVYERSGIPAEKIQVIPWGIDPDVFHPAAAPLHLPTTKSFKFLFVGGTLRRKGFDILLQAYLEEFTRADDVCLVIKDMGTSTFYRYGHHRDEILAAINDESQPEIVYIDSQMTAGQLASLYTACDVLVAPYRGEGFGLPILEAMACGLAPIVPRGGPSDDFVTDESGFFLPSREIETTHEWPLAGPPLELMVDLADLRTALREAFENRAALRAKGSAARNQAHDQFTWAQSVGRMRKRFSALACGEQAARCHRGSNGRPLLAALVRNVASETDLPLCLARLAPFVEEIVVDDPPGDRSREIAKEYGARTVPVAGGEVPSGLIQAQWYFTADASAGGH